MITKWDLVIIYENGNDLTLMSPNGDTFYMTKQEYTNYLITKQNAK